MENVEGLVEGGGHGYHPLVLKTRRTDSPSHGAVCSVSERCARTVADKDVLVRRRSHGLVLMANLAMAGGLPFYFQERRDFDHDHLPPFLSGEL